MWYVGISYRTLRGKRRADILSLRLGYFRNSGFVTVLFIILT